MSAEHLENTNADEGSEIDAILECTEHEKKLEAFCEKDFKLLCINCILSD